MTSLGFYKFCYDDGFVWKKSELFTGSKF